jgi:hypothetical protein
VSKTPGIGLDRRIDLQWLDAVAAHVAAGDDLATTRSGLFDLLDGQVTGGTKRGSACHKTVGVLTRVWSNVPAHLVTHRDRGFVLLTSALPGERIVLHWSILMAGFPFFADVAASLGRLLSLQGDIALSQLTRRMSENWGDRSTMSRATQRVVRSMVQWGVLADTADKGVYASTGPQLPVHGPVAEHLLAGLLMHENRALSVDQFLRHPALFPFAVDLPLHSLRKSPVFEIHRQGLDVDMVQLVSRHPGQGG